MNAVNENLTPDIANMLNATFQKQRSACLAGPTLIASSVSKICRNLRAC